MIVLTSLYAPLALGATGIMGQFDVHPPIMITPTLTDTEAGHDQPRQITGTGRGPSWSCARHCYWLLAQARMVRHTYLGTHWRSRPQLRGLLLSGFSLT